MKQETRETIVQETHLIRLAKITVQIEHDHFFGTFSVDQKILGTHVNSEIFDTLEDAQAYVNTL